MPTKGKDAYSFCRFFVNAFANLMLYLNYYVLMVVMAGYCMSAHGMDAGAVESSIFFRGKASSCR